jgi:hypothetical protein
MPPSLIGSNNPLICALQIKDQNLWGTWQGHLCLLPHVDCLLWIDCDAAIIYTGKSYYVSYYVIWPLVHDQVTVTLWSWTEQLKCARITVIDCKFSMKVLTKQYHCFNCPVWAQTPELKSQSMHIFLGSVATFLVLQSTGCSLPAMEVKIYVAPVTTHLSNSLQ